MAYDGVLLLFIFIRPGAMTGVFQSQPGRGTEGGGRLRPIPRISDMSAAAASLHADGQTDSWRVVEMIRLRSPNKTRFLARGIPDTLLHVQTVSDLFI